MPRSFLKPSGNLLILLEEENNGNPLGISLDTVLTTRACVKVSESHLPPVSTWVAEKKSGGKKNNNRMNRRKTAPIAKLSCPPGRKISKVLFASYGTPSGDCQSYAKGSCHASNSETIVKRVRVLMLLLTDNKFTCQI